MHERDLCEAAMSFMAGMADALAVIAGGMLAVWIRFDSGWLPVPFGRDPDLYLKYGRALLTVLPLYLFAVGYLGLYRRPQQGVFANYIPRLIRACGLGTLLVLLLNAIVKNYVDFSNGAILLALPLTSLFLLAERGLLFRLEIALARRAAPMHRILILGADAMAARLTRALLQDPRMRARIAGVVPDANGSHHHDIPPDLLLDASTFSHLDAFLDGQPEIDQLILAPQHPLSQDQIVSLILYCERRMMRFNMVPDIFRILTSGMTIQTIRDIPLLGVRQWPLDHFGNRLLKRLVDIVIAGTAIIPALPVMAAGAWLVRRESPGPWLFRQERCGRKGEKFILYKLRTMHPDAERTSGPVFARPGDPRTTRAGAWLRRHNLDELPQLWNVLRGDMSLVGPRPERPYFVEQFKDDVARYMWRHASRPGLTGWAQVNGLRGDTSIEERIKFDLFYLENWSLALDFKILLRTLFARENAY